MEMTLKTTRDELGRLRVELESDQREREERVSAAAARDKEFDEEKIMLLGRIFDLEKRLSTSFLGRLFQRFNGLLQRSCLLMWDKHQLIGFVKCLYL